MDQLLPDFKKPPLIEVALSFQFERLNLSSAHLGFLWQLYRERFPNVEEKSELSNVIERFDVPRIRTEGVKLEFSPLHSPRFWFVSENGNELIQVQKDRFIRNWRKTPDQPDYPRYRKLRAAFVEDWNVFAKFVSEETDSQIAVQQCEVTYVNILEDIDTSRLDNVFEWISGSYSDQYLQSPEEAELRLRYVLKGDDDAPWGRLHIDATPAIRVEDKQSVVRLSLTARGAPQASDLDSAMGVLDQEHDAIVRGFTSITTKQMHDHWDRIA